MGLLVYHLLADQIGTEFICHAEGVLPTSTKKVLISLHSFRATQSSPRHQHFSVCADLAMRTIILVVFGFLLRLAASCLLTGHSVHLRGRNASSNPVGKRWVRMPSDRDDDEDPNAPGAIPWGRVWKDNTIIWCFGTTERWYSIATVRHDITAAWKLWVLEGVDEQVMIFREGTDAECYDETFDQSKLLDVWPGSLASTVGQRKGVAGQMYLSETGDNGLGDRIASFAHEIGQ